MNITNVTQRRFDKILEREGKTVMDVITGEEHKVIFSRASATNMQDKIKISYAQDCPLTKGSVIEYKNNHYILINQDNIESDVYITSMAIKTNCTWYIDGKYYHLIASELSGATPKFGARTNQVSGTISLYTSKSNMIKTGDCIIDFGGAYKCVNDFTIDNITYYYFGRELMNTSGWTIDFGTDVKEVDEGSQLQLNPTMSKSGWYIPSDSITTTYAFESKNTNVATVDNNGLVSFVGNGSVTITCNGFMKAGDISIFAEGSITFTSIGGASPYATAECFAETGTTEVFDLPITDDQNYGCSKDFRITVHYFNADGSEDKTKFPAIWYFEDTNGENVPYQITDDDTYGVEYTGTVYYDEDMLDYDTATGSITIETFENTITISPPNNNTAKSTYYNPIKVVAEYDDGVTVTYVRTPLSNIA